MSASYASLTISVACSLYLGRIFRITSSTGSGSVKPTERRNARESFELHTVARTVGKSVSASPGRKGRDCWSSASAETCAPSSSRTIGARDACQLSAGRPFRNS